MKELEKTIKCKDVLLEIETRIIHTLVFPINIYGYEIWTGKKNDEGGEMICFKCGVGRELC